MATFVTYGFFYVLYQAGMIAKQFQLCPVMTLRIIGYAWMQHDDTAQHAA